MNKIKIGLLCALTSLTLGTIVPQAASAQWGESYGCTSLMVPPCPGDYSIGVDFLWWKPSIDDIDFAATRSESSENNVTDIDYHHKGICPEWGPGVRVTFDYPDLYSLCRLGMNASYTYISQDQSHSAHDIENIFILLFPGVAERDVGENPIFGKWAMQYQSWDAMFYFNCCCNDRFYITPSIGVAGIILDQEVTTKARSAMLQSEFPVDVRIKWKSHLMGVGIKTGLHANYLYNRCLTFYGFANGSILSSRSHSRNNQSFEFDNGNIPFLTRLDFKDHNCSKSVSGFHVGVGATGTFCLWGYPVAARVGYEFLQWYNVPKQRVYSEDITTALGQSSTTTRTFGFHGPFAGVVLSF
jgi:hypothetical protein